jgi:hypothetical protein
MRSYHTREMRQMDRAGYENALVLFRAIPFDPEALENLMEDQTEASEERLEYAREALIAHPGKKKTALAIIGYGNPRNRGHIQ